MKINLFKCLFGVGSSKLLGFMVNHRGIKAHPVKIQPLLNMKSPTKPKEVQSLTEKIVVLNRFVLRAMNKCLPFFNAL